MKQRSSIFSKSIATRLMLVNTLICAVFILIAVVTFLSFQHIEDVLTQNVTKEIDGAIEMRKQEGILAGLFRVRHYWRALSLGKTIYWKPKENVLSRK